jgi:iron complex outermembrane recepter protein
MCEYPFRRGACASLMRWSLFSAALFPAFGLKAQQAAEPATTTQLPAVVVEQKAVVTTPKKKQKSAKASTAKSEATAATSKSEGHSQTNLGAFGPGPAKGYQAKSASTGTKTDTPLLDTPMAVQVVPKEVLADRQVTTVQEAVKTVSGVQPAPGYYYDSFLIRGFDSSGNAYRNGLHLSGVVGFEDFAFVDHIEIAKGPSAMLYGRVQPGGIINYVTKQPLETAAYSVQQQLDNWGEFRTTVDATGPVTTDKSLLYRIVGTFDRGETFIDYQDHDNKAILGALKWRPNSSFEANAQVEHYDQKNINLGYSGQQIPTIGNRPADLPRNWTQNDPLMWENFPGHVDRTLVSFDWTAKLSENWKLTHRFLYNHADELQSYLLYQGFNAATGIMNRRISYNTFDRDIFSTNLDLNGRFVTGPLKHDVLIGVDWYNYEQKSFGYNESGATLNRVPPLDIYNPVYGNIDVALMRSYFDAAAKNDLYNGTQKDTGFYAQDQVSIGDLEVLFGGRYDVATDAASRVYGSITAACFPSCDGALVEQPTVEKFSPRLGVLYKLLPNASIYGSYSESFGSTTTTVTYNGSPFPPQTGVQYEAGAKAEFLDGKLSTSVSLFDLYLQNRSTADPDHPGFSIAAGEVRSRGLEFDVAGQLTNNLSLIGSYTYDNAVVTKDSSYLGKTWAGVPLHSGSVWAKWDTAPRASDAWFYGAGVYVSGERQANITNKVQLPDYARCDAMIGYRTLLMGTEYTAQLNVQNVFDTTYFDNSTGTYSTYGAPRTWLASLRADF